MPGIELNTDIDDLVFDEPLVPKRRGNAQTTATPTPASVPAIAIQISEAHPESEPQPAKTPHPEEQNQPNAESEFSNTAFLDNTKTSSKDELIQTAPAVPEMRSPDLDREDAVALVVEAPSSHPRKPRAAILIAEDERGIGPDPDLPVTLASAPEEPVMPEPIETAPAERVTPVEHAAPVENAAPVERLPPVENAARVENAAPPAAQPVEDHAPSPAPGNSDEILKLASSLSRLAKLQAAPAGQLESLQIPNTSGPAVVRALKTTFGEAEKKQSLDLFETLLASAVKGGASDLLLKQGQVPMFRWNGDLYPSRNGPRMESSFFEHLASALLNERHLEHLNGLNDVDFSYHSPKAGRVRMNVFRQRGELGMVVRLIPSEIPTLEKLEMGQNIRQLIEQKRGLILVTGATGSGKSTTLAAMLDYINSNRTSHVITIEDPVEFVHKDKRSMFNQRELGLDTQSYAAALKSALRQAPDVILVGELRDAETTEVALQAAETGHLVLSTLHTNDAADSLLRIMGMLGHDKEPIVRAQLADCLRGVVSQRLLKRKDRPGRIAAQEVMVNTATIREKLLKGGHPSIVRDLIHQGGYSGMQSFDQHLLQLVKAGLVDVEEAMRNATNRDDLALLFNGVSDGRKVS